MERFLTWGKMNYKIILAVIIPIAVIAVIFALPLKVVAIPVTESYWDTEIRTENYTTTETYSEMEPYITSEMHTETIYNQAIGYGNWVKTFQVDHPGSTVTIEVNNYGIGYYGPRYIIVGDNYSAYWRGNPYWIAGWEPWNTYGGFGCGQALATIRITYPVEVTKYRPVTKTREVVKFRDVPTQVRRERTVIQNVRMSIWESIFR